MAAELSLFDRLSFVEAQAKWPEVFEPKRVDGIGYVTYRVEEKKVVILLRGGDRQAASLVMDGIFGAGPLLSVGHIESNSPGRGMGTALMKQAFRVSLAVKEVLGEALEEGLGLTAAWGSNVFYHKLGFIPTEDLVMSPYAKLLVEEISSDNPKKHAKGMKQARVLLACKRGVELEEIPDANVEQAWNEVFYDSRKERLEKYAGKSRAEATEAFETDSYLMKMSPELIKEWKKSISLPDRRS